MKWSQLKKRVESNFAPSVKSHVQIWNTRYHNSHDAEGEAWITLDGKRIWSMGTFSYYIAENKEVARIRKERGCSDYRDPAQHKGYIDAIEEAQQNVQEEGVFTMYDTNNALFDYLNLSIEAAIKSDNPIIRAFVTLDRRFGKRRLLEFDDSTEHPLVKTLYRLRCEAEGIKYKSQPLEQPGSITDMLLPGS